MFTTATRRPAATEWGPAKHDPEHPLHRETQDVLATVLRDGDAARPDDN